MDIFFATAKLQKQCSTHAGTTKAYGPDRARKIQQRLLEMKAAARLSDLCSLPPTRCHELTADRKGQLAVTIKDQWRLIFEPNHDPLPKSPDGSLNWAEVTAITIVEVEDYHGD